VAWTYVPDFSTQRDRVRVLINDIDSTDPLVSDEIIALFGTDGAYAQANDYLTAASVAQHMVGVFRRMPQSLSAGGTSVTYGNRVADFTSLAASLRAMSSRSAAVFAGGITQSSKDVQTDNTDVVSPAFTRSMGDTGPTRTTQPGEPEKYGVWG
jgi:hypothetical protein